MNIYLTVYGPEHIEVARTQNDFGVLHFKLGLYTEADQYCRASLALAMRLYGSQHPDVANILVNIADVALEMKNTQAAARAYRQAPDILGALYKDHPQYLKCIGALEHLKKQESSFLF